MKLASSKKAGYIASDIFNLALMRAKNISKRTGISWALMGSQSEVLACDAVIAGLDKGKLIDAIGEHQNALDHLYISMEPVSGIFDIAYLIAMINASNCNHITIGYRHPNEICDKSWRKWESSWKGRIDYLSENPLVTRLGYGITNVKKYQRPWVTAVTAATFTGLTLPLNNFINEFGFLNYISSLIQENRGLLYSSSQKNFLTSIPDTNHMDEPLETFEILNKSNIKSILQHCANENRCSVIVLCDMPLLGYLAAEDLIDEIVLHTSNIYNGPADEQACTTQNSLRLNDWKLQSSAIAGNCSRVILQKCTPDKEQRLWHGLN